MNETYLKLSMFFGSIIFVIIVLFISLRKKWVREREIKDENLEKINFFVGKMGGDAGILYRANNSNKISRVELIMKFEKNGKIIIVDMFDNIRQLYFDGLRPFSLELSFKIRHINYSYSMFVGRRFFNNGGSWGLSDSHLKEGVIDVSIIDKNHQKVCFRGNDYYDAWLKILPFIDQYSSVSEFLLDETLRYIHCYLYKKEALNLHKAAEEILQSCESKPVDHDLNFEIYISEMENSAREQARS